jgi:hypothetical protein
MKSMAQDTYYVNRSYSEFWTYSDGCRYTVPKALVMRDIKRGIAKLVEVK